MQIFDEAATRDALPFDRLIPALRDLFRTGCTVPPRHVHEVKGDQAQGTVLIMPAWTPKYLGIKTVNIYPGNAKRGLPGLFAAYTLFDATTGEGLAQLDGNVITARRTAASSALAATYLARPEARRLAVFGAGRVASLLPLAYAAAFRLEQVTVWARSADQADRLAEALQAQGLPATGSDDPVRTVREADIVSTATLATHPLVQGEWLAGGSHLDLVGGFTPAMREADDACFAGARIFVDTQEALQKAGDLLVPIANGTLAATDVRGTLADLCSGRTVGREHPRQRTVFKSVGTALEDLAAAILVYESRDSSKS